MVHSWVPKALNGAIVSSFFFEQLSMRQNCEICLRNRERSEVFKSIFVVVVVDVVTCAIISFLIIDNFSPVQ